MNNYVHIAVDVMGGDYGPKVTVPAAVSVLKSNSNLKIYLVGKEEEVKLELSKVLSSCSTNILLQERLKIIHTDQIVEMDESPSLALRNKKKSSMRLALNLVKDGVANGCVSAGNTGALMAIARFVLRMIPGIDRPAILFPIPTKNGKVNVLDLGANLECRAENLLQFAVMGSTLVKAVEDISKPRVGLLNVGKEEIKGTEQVKQAAILLENNKHINYVGYVEGDDLYLNNLDVVVCDGFVGNVTLKSSEGLAKMILKLTEEEFSKNLYTKLIGFLAKPVLKSLQNKIDPVKYNGASLLGLQGVVVKSHGNANIEAFSVAIHSAVKEVEKNIPELIKDIVSNTLSENKKHETC